MVVVCVCFLPFFLGGGLGGLYLESFLYDSSIIIIWTQEEIM